MSAFEGDTVKRYDVVWSNSKPPNLRLVGDAGAGGGEGFVDFFEGGRLHLGLGTSKDTSQSIEKRLSNKPYPRRSWENCIFGVSVTIRCAI